jgi:hypothetical protein
MKGRRVFKMNKIIRGATGVHKCEMMFEWSPITRSWWMMPVKWYEAKFPVNPMVKVPAGRAIGEAA